MTEFNVGDTVVTTGDIWEGRKGVIGKVLSLLGGNQEKPVVRLEDETERDLSWYAWGEYAVELVRAADVAQEETNEVPDAINPAHYQGFSNGAQVIDITENLNFNRGNAVKYLARAGAKDPAKEIEDIKKAIWYAQRELARLEG